MIICDRCEDRHNNSGVGIQVSGINNSDINWYHSPPTDYSKDLCINCKRDLLVALKEFFAENPKAPKPAPPRVWTKEQITNSVYGTWGGQGIDGDVEQFLKGVFDDLF